MNVTYGIHMCANLGGGGGASPTFLKVGTLLIAPPPPATHTHTHTHTHTYTLFGGLEYITILSTSWSYRYKHYIVHANLMYKFKLSLLISSKHKGLQSNNITFF